MRYPKDHSVLLLSAALIAAGFAGTASASPATVHHERAARGADLAVKQVPLKPEGRVGEPISIRLKVINNGPATARDISVIVNRPQDAKPVTFPPECVLTGLNFECAISMLRADRTHRIKFRYRPSRQKLIQQATVSADTADPRKRNNHSSLNVPIRPR